MDPNPDVRRTLPFSPKTPMRGVWLPYMRWARWVLWIAGAMVLLMTIPVLMAEGPGPRAFYQFIAAWFMIMYPSVTWGAYELGVMAGENAALEQVSDALKRVAVFERNL